MPRAGQNLIAGRTLGMPDLDTKNSWQILTLDLKPKGQLTMVPLTACVTSFMPPTGHLHFFKKHSGVDIQ